MKKGKFKAKLATLALTIMMIAGLFPIISMSVEAANDIERYTVLVLDISGSMSGDPLAALKKASIKFCDSVFADDGKNFVAIVTYHDYANTICNFTSNYSTLENAINNISLGDSTNTTQGLQYADNLLSSITDGIGIIKNILLLSDGLPNRGIYTAIGQYSSVDYSNYDYANATYETAVSLKNKGYNFYSLGFFHSLTGNTLSFARRFMNDMQNAGYYDVVNPDDLDFTFGQVAENVIDSSNNYPIIYDPGASITLPTEKLTAVTDVTTAVEAVQSAVSGLTAEQKSSATGVDLLTLFAEEAVAQAASASVLGGGIIVNQTTVYDLQFKAAAVKAVLETTLTNASVKTMRYMNADVKFKTNETKKVIITVEPSAANTTADNVRVETGDYAVSIPREAIVEGTANGNLVITIEEIANTTTVSGAFVRRAVPGGQYAASSTKKEVSYRVTLDKNLKENVKYSFPALEGDVEYQAVFRADGTPVGGKYNPATKKIDVRIRYSDTYTVRVNKKNFTDISKKSASMQEAIKILASKGIINGTSASMFSPDDSITRAEIAALVVRTLSKLNDSADGKFTDVKKSDWYFGAVGSAKAYGIINGTSATTFEPNAKILKEQIIAIAARTLRSEMKYNNPSNAETYLKKFADRDKLPSWGTNDFALASMADLIVLRTDGKFAPTDTMTRGDAAIVLYRLFMKIW